MSNRTSSDKLLFIIVAGILLLVVVAFAVIASRPGPEFQAQDTPESVVHDYLLALQLGDYERAFGALSPTLGYPATYEEFYDSLEYQPWEFSVDDGYSIVVEGSETIGDKKAAVIVRQITNTNSLFAGSGYAETFRMRVEDTSEGWKLIDGGRFWSSCWGAEYGCEDEFPRPVTR